MLKLKDLILERPQSEKSHKTEIMTKLDAPMVAKILKKQNLHVVGTVTSKHNYASDISDYYWDEDRADKPLDKKYEWAVGWNKAAGWIQFYNRDTNSDTYQKYWKPKKPTRKLYFALKKKLNDTQKIDFYQDEGTLYYKAVISDDKLMKTFGFKSGI